MQSFLKMLVFNKIDISKYYRSRLVAEYVNLGRMWLADLMDNELRWFILVCSNWVSYVDSGVDRTKNK